MYSVYTGRKISNRFTKFVDLGRYVNQINELSNDDAIPRFSTHLIYLTKANNRHEVEEKLSNRFLLKSQTG